MSSDPPWSLAERVERRILASRIIVALALAVLALAVALAQPGIGGDVVVSRYDLALDGERLTLYESITYRVQGGEYHMLYRSWSWPVSPRGGNVIPLSVSCPEGLVPYIVYHNGTARPLASAPEEVAHDIAWRAESAEARDELGCYSRAPLAPGEYTIIYSWRLDPPPSARHRGALLVPLAVEGRHVDYERVSGRVRAGSLAIAPASLDASARRAGDGYTVEIEGVDERQGLYLAVGDTHSRWVEEYASMALIAVRLEEALIAAGAGAALLVPPAALAVYYARGREPPASGPIPAGSPPRTGEKPWEVNVLYHGEPGYASRHAIAATILDLLARGVLRLEAGRVLVLPGEASGLDWYEERVVRLLREIAGDGRLDLGDAPAMARRAAGRVRGLVGELLSGERLRALAENAVEPGDRAFGLLLLLSLALAIPVNLAIYKLLPLHDQALAMKALATNLLAAGSSIAILSMPSHVLGRWRRGYLERYTAWMLYAENAGTAPPLGDLRALAYLVALGREDEVKRALEGLPTPESRLVLDLLRAVTALSAAAAATRSSGSSGSSGGGGGAGAR